MIPVGYSVLPDAGGVLDQSYPLMHLFDIFMSAERKVAFDKLKK
jgi:hypothetical protein